MTAEKSRALDKELLEGLARVGFKLDFGEDNTGWQFKYLTRGGGYYFNVGCSDLIVKGDIALKQFSDIDTFIAGGAQDEERRDRCRRPRRAGDRLQAPGRAGAQAVRREVEKRVGTIWGFGDEQELRNMYTRTGQAGLWLIAGGLAQCRIGSKHLALQIKAIEEGLLPRTQGRAGDEPGRSEPAATPSHLNG